MKNSKLKLMLLMVTCGMVSALGAGAEVPTGYLEGKFKNANGSSTDKAHVLIQTINVQGVPVSYGLVIRGSDEKAALFRIEELDDGSQAWIRFAQTGSKLIGTNVNQEAAFSVQRVGDGLAMLPTPSGRTSGCSDELEVYASSGLAWQSLPSGQVFEGGFGDDSRVTVNFSNGSGLLSGKFKLGDQTLNGSFSLNEIIPGIAALRSQVLNPESADGRSLERGMTALVAMIRHERAIFSDYDRLHFIRITDGEMACLDETSALDGE